MVGLERGRGSWFGLAAVPCVMSIYVWKNRLAVQLFNVS